MAYNPPSEFSIPPNGDVDSNRTCVSCGYELRGLPWGSACPECGQDPKVQAKSRSSIREDLPLSQMSPTFIRRFALCCLAATLVFPAIIARMFVPYVQIINESIGLSIDFVIASMWIVGVYVLTSPMNHPLAIRYGLGAKGISTDCSLVFVFVDWHCSSCACTTINHCKYLSYRINHCCCCWLDYVLFIARRTF